MIMKKTEPYEPKAYTDSEKKARLDEIRVEVGSEVFDRTRKTHGDDEIIQLADAIRYINDSGRNFWKNNHAMDDLKRKIEPSLQRYSGNLLLLFGYNGAAAAAIIPSDFQYVQKVTKASELRNEDRKFGNPEIRTWFLARR